MRRSFFIVQACIGLLCLVQACAVSTPDPPMTDKIVIYQVFTRLFGSDSCVNQPNADRAVNGCGTMADFTTKALTEIRSLGVTHIWYTGIIEHATQTDYTAYGICRDHPAIVKGKAGSVYAIKDYYDVDPDLATNVPSRMKEFQNLVARTHRAGLKVILCVGENLDQREAGQHFDVVKSQIENVLFIKACYGSDFGKVHALAVPALLH